MSNGEKKGFLTKEMSRRQFMKISGKSLAGLALSTSMLSLFNTTQAEVDSGAVTTFALAKGLLVVNTDKCTGCQRCELNCTLVNDGKVSSYMSRIKVTHNLFSSRNGSGLYTEDRWTYFPDTCRQCADPACANVCPMKAIYADENGVKLIDEEKCVGCGACERICPRSAIRLLDVNVKAVVRCRNTDPGKEVRAVCTKGCLACGMCVRACEHEAIAIIDGYAQIDYEKCVGCGKCATACKFGVISFKED